MKSTFFGLTTFQKSMELQSQVHSLVSSSGFPAVLGFEYYPVVTLGKRAEVDQELVAAQSLLTEQGFELVQTDRGGQATLHSPGQLVIYPIVPIQKLQISVRKFVEILQTATENWLHQFKISTKERPLGESGVFTDIGKIAFIGIRVERGVTRHGLSINLNNDLNLFSQIKACGQTSRPLDSLFQHGFELDLKEAFQNWILYFTAELMDQLPAPTRTQN